MRSKDIAGSILALCTLGLAAFLTGCVHAHGTKAAADTEARSKVIKGVTTKSEVHQLLGKPTGITDMGEKGEMWTYTYSKTQARATNFIPIVGSLAGGADTETHSVSIKFDLQGVVQTISEYDSQGGGGGIQDLNR